MFIQNLEYLISLLKSKQSVGNFRKKDFANAINITPQGLTAWLKGRRSPTPNYLKRISQYISEQFNIPIDLFENGKALLDKDIKQIITKHRYSKKSLGTVIRELPEYLDTTEIPQNLSQDELRLIAAIRKISGAQNKKLAKDDIDFIIEVVGHMGVGSDYMKGFTSGAKLQNELLQTMKKHRGKTD